MPRHHAPLPYVILATKDQVMNSPTPRTRYLNSLRIGSALAVLGLLVSPAVTPATVPKVVHVGMVKSLFRDVPDPVVHVLLFQFGTLMHQHTGLKGQIVTSGDALELASQLDKGQVDLGMLHGFEFAWVQHKFPHLKSLMLAVKQQPYLAVHLVTRSGSKITSFADLKGKKISLPILSGGHCQLFLDRHCDKAGSAAEKYFGKIVHHTCVENSLDDVYRGEVDAAVVDSQMLECYHTVKPGCAAQLKTLEKSEPFPAVVIVYREGALTAKTLDTFRQGMLSANKDAKSRGLMTLWKLTAFEPVPADFQTALDNIRKAYPAPTAWSAAPAAAASAGAQGQ